MTRLVELFRVTSSATAIVLLIGFNLVPLAGVLWWGWSVFTLLVLYWLENGIIGAINIAKILRAEGDAGSARSAAASFRLNAQLTRSRAGMVGFFVMHYGIFWVVHGIFVLTLPLFIGIGSMTSDLVDGFPPADGADPGFGPDRLFPPLQGPDLRLDVIAFGAAGLAISHTASYVLDYIGRGEYRRVSAAAQTMAPYGRVLVLHMTIILGALFSSFLGTPVAALVVLVGAKTLLDLVLHLAERRRAGDGAVLAT